MNETLASFDETRPETAKQSTASGAAASTTPKSEQAQAVLRLLEPKPRRGRHLIGWSVVAASFAWIAGFFASHIGDQTRPWSIVLGCCAIFTLLWLYGKTAANPLSAFKIGESRPLVISEGLSFSYLAFSLIIIGFLSLYAISPHQTNVRRQLVDIELVASNDAVDRHDILPGTVKNADQEKKVASNATVQERGRTLTATTAEARQKEAPTLKANSSSARNSATKANRETGKSKTESPTDSSSASASRFQHFEHRQQAKRFDSSANGQEQQESAQSERGRTLAHVSNKTLPKASVFREPLSPAPQANMATASINRPQLQPMRPLPSHWQTKTIAAAKRSAAPSNSSRGSAALEEVAPPEMVELTDSAGEANATELWQAGGHSSGGTGSKTTLATYLKELHRRIKRSWSPPPGETRTAEILFRIQRNGKLASVKLARSSGDSQADEAAMGAIAACAPFKALPEEFSSQYLDLLYTFNYTADHLAEVQNQSTE